jgi:y4mF family transcriptional regulator
MQQKEIGELIQQRRAKLSLKQEDLSEMTGVTGKTIYLIESGKGNPSLQTLQKVLSVLGLEINIDIKKTVE